VGSPVPSRVPLAFPSSSSSPAPGRRACYRFLALTDDHPSSPQLDDDGRLRVNRTDHYKLNLSRARDCADPSTFAQDNFCRISLEGP